VATRFLIGTSGWNYAHWRRRFYPAHLPSEAWLGYYAAHFPTVEINYTFYRLPAAPVFSSWRRAVPASFVFAVKASRFITHIKRLRAVRRSVRLLLSRRTPCARRPSSTCGFTAPARAAGTARPGFGIGRNRLRAIGDGAHTAYIYFNNDWRGYAVQNAARLTELLC